MTDTQLNQLRQNLVAQFHQMMTEAIAPDPDENLGGALEWGSKY